MVTHMPIPRDPTFRSQAQVVSYVMAVPPAATITLPCKKIYVI